MEKWRSIAFSDTENMVLTEAKKQGKNVFGLTVYVQETCILKAARAFLVYKALEELGETVISVPSAQDIEDEKFDFDFSIIFITDADLDKVKAAVMNVSEIDPERLLSLYSIVFQDVTLFNNTVMENIRIGKKDATDEEVMEAARLANCTDFIERLPEKWNTLIGENGSELSGGERQRISIARAFLKDAPIILLDEATASLDVDNETMIQESLSRLIKDKTVMIIAHRMRTVANADKIVVLKDGVVAESGTPSELDAKDGIYANMVKTQNLAADWAL